MVLRMIVDDKLEKVEALAMRSVQDRKASREAKEAAYNLINVRDVYFPMASQ